MNGVEYLLSNEVYNILKAKIISNELDPGDRLVETDIAKNLQVSRTPIREALKQLEQDGLVTYYPRRGSVVSEISVKDALEMYEVREVIEGLAVRLLCMNINRKDIQSLEEIVLDMEERIKSEDYDSLLNLHSKWNSRIMDLTKNKYLKNQMIGLYENLGRLRRISLYNLKDLKSACEEIKKILQGITDGDEDQCQQLAGLHVRNAKERFLANVKRIKL